MASYLLVLLAGLVAGCISGVIGTGSSLMLLPVLVYAFGPLQAVPIMAVAAIMGNLARVLVWWKEVDWRAFAAYSLPAIPAASLGARTLLGLPPQAIEFALGVFFLCMIPLRRWHLKAQIRLQLWHLALAGAVIGFLTGLVLSTGPLSVPVFLSYGLDRGAFLSTEAASSVVIYISKVITFQQLGALPVEVALRGVLVGSSLMAGTYAGKIVVARMSPHAFAHVLDALMLCSGLSMLWAAWR